MNFQELQYFLAVAEEKSFSRAAEALYVSQPAVSRQISALEQELGVRLFTRDRRSVTLTKEGEACRKAAQEIMDGCARLSELAKTLKNNCPSCVRIGYPNMTVLKTLPEILQTLKKEYPETRFDLIQTPPFETALRALSEKELDAVITSQTFVVNDPRFDYRLIQSGRLAAVLACGDPRANQSELRFEQLKNDVVLIHRLQSDCWPRQQLIADCRRHGLSSDQLIEVAKTDDIFIKAALGEGVGLMPECFLDGRIQNLPVLRVTDSDNQYGAVLAYCKDEENPVVRRMAACYMEKQTN